MAPRRTTKKKAVSDSAPDGDGDDSQPCRGLATAVRRFVTHLRLERGLSENTVVAYRSDVERFVAGLRPGRKADPASIQEPDVFEFLVSERRRDMNPRSVRRSLAAVRTFFRFLVLEGTLEESPARFLETPQIGKTLPFVLDQSQTERLLDATKETASRYPLRDRALLETIYASGLRVSEAINLNFEDIFWDHGILRCFGKGEKERLVPISKTALAAIKEYLENERPRLSRNAPATPGPERVFLSRSGRALGREVVSTILRTNVLKAGLVGKITPHTLRHSFATHLLHNGADLRIVQEILGHVNVATTEIYTHVEKSQLKSAHRKFHPRG